MYWKMKLFFNTLGLIVMAPFKFMNWCFDMEKVYKAKMILMYIVFFILLGLGIFDSHMFANSQNFWSTVFVIALVMLALKLASSIIILAFDVLEAFTAPLAEAYDNMMLYRYWYKKFAKEGIGGAYQSKGNYSNQNNAAYDEYTLTKEEAMRLFAVKEPFTIDDLKKKRRILQKFYHPDAGGNEIMSKRINQAYDLLEKYTTKKTETKQENNKGGNDFHQERKGEEKNEKGFRSLH